MTSAESNPCADLPRAPTVEEHRAYVTEQLIKLGLMHGVTGVRAADTIYIVAEIEYDQWGKPTGEIVFDGATFDQTMAGLIHRETGGKIYEVKLKTA